MPDFGTGAGFDTGALRGQFSPMKHDGAASGDSQRDLGGEIPGSNGQAAFSLSGSRPSAIPVLIAVPHAGRVYPAPLLERMRNPSWAALRLEDRYADLIGEAVAAATGATLLTAHAPRAMIDLNRSADDVDWEMFGRRNDDVGSYTPGRRARNGLGLIPRRLPGVGELWKWRHEEPELAARIANIHAPYHARLAQELATLRDRWGAALLLDLHSMPPLPSRPGQQQAEFVLGDRFGASCHGGLIATAFSHFAEARRPAAHNRPYAGGYVLERHAAPGKAIHAFQLEIDRSSYLDSHLAEPGPGFADIVDLVIGLVRRLAGDVALLGEAASRSRWAEAAE